MVFPGLPAGLSAGEVRLHEILRQVGQAEPGQYGVQSQGDVVEHQLPFDPHLQLPFAPLELPGVEPAGGR